jgi:hypothetical protein
MVRQKVDRTAQKPKKRTTRRNPKLPRNFISSTKTRRCQADDTKAAPTKNPICPIVAGHIAFCTKEQYRPNENHGIMCADVQSGRPADR